MTRCEDIRPHLAALVDGELVDAVRQTVDEHLSGCVDCAAIARDYGIIKATAIVDVVEEDLWDGVSARLDVVDATSLLLTEIRSMRQEMQSLRSEVAELRQELSRRLPSPSPRTSPFSFPDAPERTLKQYRLV